MALGWIFCKMALLTSLFALPPQSSAQAVPGSATSNAGAFRTDGLSPQQVKLWNSIRKIVLAPDKDGRPLHPTLYGLWRTVEQSGHLVFVELITDKQRFSNIAGECLVEEFDPTGHRHAFRLRLFIPTIERAFAGEQAPQEGLEFVPFGGLTRQERYAKVLGHELAHLANMLRDPDYLRLLRAICMEQSAIAAGVRADGRTSSNAELQERSNLVWPLVLNSEKPALAAEAKIYRELLRK
jgi:hypothetical protein